MQCEINPSHFGRENFLNASLFVLLFVLLLLFFSCCFFFGGGRGLGLGLLFFWGAGIQRNATLTQSITLRSAIVGRENLIAGGLFVLFFCLFVFLFLFHFYYFSGKGGG